MLPLLSSTRFVLARTARQRASQHFEARSALKASYRSFTAEGSAAAAITSLTQEQRTRTVAPVFWRSLHLQRGEADDGPRAVCSDRLATVLAAKLVSSGEEAAMLEASGDNGALEADVAGVHGAFLDRILLDAVGRRLRQVILLGAGMDTRAYRLDLPPQMRLIEMEEEEVLVAKAEILAEAGHRTRCQRLPSSIESSLLSGSSGGDALLEGLEAALKKAPLQLQKPSLVFLGEGLLNGLWHGVEQSALTALANVAANGSRLIAPVRPLNSSELSTGDVLNLKITLEEAGWSRVDVVGHKALSRIFHRSPPDDKAVLLVAERGHMAPPGRPAAERPPAASSASGQASGRPREVSF